MLCYVMNATMRVMGLFMTCAVVGLVGRGDITHGPKRLNNAPFHADV